MKKSSIHDICGTILGVPAAASFLAHIFVASTGEYPGLIGELLISWLQIPAASLLIVFSIFFFICGARTEKKEKKKEMRFHDNYGDFI